MGKVSKPKDTRKIRYTEVQLKDIYLHLEDYIQNTDFPTLAAFVSRDDIRHKFKLTPNYVWVHPELFDGHLSVMKAKCEAFLVRKGLSGVAMPMTIFLLKQNQYGGYSDREQIDITSNQQPIKFVNAVPRPPKTKKK